MNTALPLLAAPRHRLTGLRCIAASLLTPACAAQAQVGMARLDLAGHSLAATLARAGFVVAQPLHAGDSHADGSRAGHFNLLHPWPDSVAQTVAALQQRGGLPQPGFDARLRSQAQTRIADFHRQHLDPL